MTLQETYEKYKDLVSAVIQKHYKKVEKYGFSKEFLRDIVISIIQKESEGNPNAVGDYGCSIGLMQLNWCAGTPQRFGVKKKELLFNPAINIDAGVQYLFYLINYTGGDIIKAISGYNAGEGRIGINYASYVKPVVDYFNMLSEKKIQFSLE